MKGKCKYNLLNHGFTSSHFRALTLFSIQLVAKVEDLISATAHISVQNNTTSYTSPFSAQNVHFSWGSDGKINKLYSWEYANSINLL